MSTLTNIRSSLAVAILLIAVLGMVVSTAAGDSQNSDISEGGQGFAELNETKVAIDKKTPEVVITNGRDRFGVYDGTLIVGLEGEQVNYRDMLVPCTATISYLMEKGTQKSERIQILEIASNAKPHFSYERPQ